MVIEVLVFHVMEEDASIGDGCVLARFFSIEIGEQREVIFRANEVVEGCSYRLWQNYFLRSVS